MSRTRLVVPCVLAAVAVSIALPACGGDSEASGGGADRSTTSAPVTTASVVADVTTINGSPPPAQMAPLEDVATMLDTIDAEGKRLVVTRGVRKAGTRAAIHTHEYGGHTCVMSGVITDFVEGHEPMVFPAGTCYYMPPDTLMTATNLGAEDAVLVDTFNLPPGAPTITIREPGWPGS